MARSRPGAAVGHPAVVGEGSQNIRYEKHDWVTSTVSLGANGKSLVLNPPVAGVLGTSAMRWGPFLNGDVCGLWRSGWRVGSERILLTLMPLRAASVQYLMSTGEGGRGGGW